MRALLPPALWDDLQQHIRRKVREAVSNYAESASNEDSLTTDLCAALCKRISRSYGPDGVWRWRIRYRKFGSGGEGSEESVLGADGIFQVEIHGRLGERIEAKGLLFQSKKESNTQRAAMYGQLADMEELVPNGMLRCSSCPKPTEAFPAPSPCTTWRENVAFPDHPFQSLDQFLVDSFLACSVGREKLYYDFDRAVLVVPNRTTGVDLYSEALSTS